MTWRRKKQPVVIGSSVKAEYRVMALGICELMGTLSKESQVDVEEPMRLYCKDKAAISIIHNPIQHDRTKHVEVDKKMIDNGFICTPFVSSKLQLANKFTKGVSNPSFNSVTCKLRMNHIFKPA